MHSQLKGACLALLMASSAAHAVASPDFSHAAVQAAVDELRRDPNLGHDTTTRSLRWIHSNESPPAEAPQWIVGLFQFASQAGSLLLWVVGGIGVAMATIWAFRQFQARRPAPRIKPLITASHIQHLDIRPTSLPADVGAAALALLSAGRTRESLSLLYRGSLSRAVHNFSAVIAESATEGEALRAVRQRLEPRRAQYVAAVVALWQRAVYAEDILPNESIAALCKDFSPALGDTPI